VSVRFAGSESMCCVVLDAGAGASSFQAGLEELWVNIYPPGQTRSPGSGSSVWKN